MNDDHNETKHFDAGNLIITKGYPADAAYLVKSGKVRVFLNKDSKNITLAELEEGAIFGESALFEGGVYGAHVEAIEPTELIVITPESFQDKIEKSDPMLRSIITMLMARQRKTNQALLESETREFMDIVLI